MNTHFPAGPVRWELVAAKAQERGVLTTVLVSQLQAIGAQPTRIAGVWMVRADAWDEHEARLPPPPAAPVAGPAGAPSEPGPKQLPAPLPDAIAEAMARQAAAIEELHRQLVQLTGRLSAKEQA